VGAVSTVVGAVDGEPLWAPPLLLIVTPGVTSVDDEVEPVDGVEVVVVWVVVPSVLVEPDTVDDGAVEPVAVPVVSVSVVSVLVVSVLSAVEADDSLPSARASPGEVITAMPMPSAAARAPTRPM
jgi:hypothetical protein